ncbi:hypothetical protein EVG20_g6401 [Dentipellis fragilis]|uniref:Uncharacterized protein n=1 Tax=Dentipellis fragilis TaxID=205917 RepID=A0A4Y9YKZ0_9AGAM|nr:hypothetical protein EVG20_g6401 [Dentipellis fragilis]
MLSLARAANTVRPVCARALATAPDFPPVHSSVSPPPAPLIPPQPANAEAGDRARATKRRLLGPTVYVRPWNSMQTMVDGLAILQALERRYGRVVDVFYPRVRLSPSLYTTLLFHFLSVACASETDGAPQDADLRNNYMFFFKITFHASVDPHIVPEDGEMLKIRVPDKPRGTPVAFEDLQRFLGARTAESDASTDLDAEAENWRVEDVRVERSNRQLSSHSAMQSNAAVPRQRASIRNEFAHAWTGWAGFSTPADAPADVAPPTKDIDPATAHLHAANARWRRVAAQAKSQLVAMEADLDKVDAEVEELKKELAAESPVEEWKPIRPREEKADVLTDVEAHADVRAEVLETAEIEAKVEAEAEAVTPKMSRRERILQQARENALTAKDEGVDAVTKTTADVKGQGAETEKEADVKLKSIQERLWKLVGAKW